MLGLPPKTLSLPIFGQNGRIIINNNSWQVEIVGNEVDRVRGLSNRTILSKNTGMLFTSSQMSRQFFWMKEMLIPLDMIFLDNNLKIVLIESNIQPNTFPKTFGGDVESQYVLEINALESKVYDLQVGDQAIFQNK